MVKISLKKGTGHLILLSTIVGFISGIGALALYVLIDVSTQFFISGLDNFIPPHPAGEISLITINFKYGKIPLFIIPAIGGLLSGLIVYKFAPEAEGHGTDAVIRAFHKMRGEVRARVPAIKALATAITIGSGGSAGREGPIAQIGAGFGSIIASLLNLSDRDRRILVVSGVAGGIGSIFRSPFGGAIFAIEVLYKKDYEVEAMIPAFTSSIVAFTVFEAVLGKLTHTPFASHTIFSTPSMTITSPSEMLLCLLLGFIAAGIAVLYVKTFYFIHDFFKRVKITNYVKPIIGGVFTGLIAIFIPQALGMSYGYVQLAIDGKLAVETILLIMVAKILATSFTIGSGGSGGVFAPSIVIGSMVGAAVGYTFYGIMPNVVAEPQTFVLVGMVAFVSAAAKTPIAAIMMALEMTGGYSLLPALMLASIVAYKASGDVSIYREQVDSRIDSPAHRRELTRDVLENILVKDAMTPKEQIFTLNPSDKVSDLFKAIEEVGHLGYPVVDNGKVVGMVTLEDAVKVPPEDRNSLKIEDIMSKKLITINPDDTLEDALKLLSQYDVGRLLVVKDGKFVGIITRSDIMRAHASEILKS